MNCSNWYAIRVRSRCEKLAATDLAQRGIAVCAATAPQRRDWVDRVRVVDMPLFPGYIFANFERAHRITVLRASGVSGILGVSGVDEPVPDAEVRAVEVLMASGLEAVQTPYLRAGSQVRVRRGPLAGLTGIFEQTRNQSRIVLSVNLLQRSVAVEVDAAMVDPVRPVEGSRIVRAEVA